VRDANPATLLVTSFALSYLLQNLALVIFGPIPRGVDLPKFVSSYVEVAGLRISTLDVVTVVITLGLIGGLALFLKATEMGIQMRAAAEDFRMAQLLGVRPNRVIAIAFVISGLLAGAAGIVLVSHLGTASPSMGLQPVLIGFVAAVVGGLGSIPGAAVGGMALGCLSIGLDAALPPGMRPYRDALVFTLVILTLLIRPNGLFPAKSQYARV
jgi:branched-chain amino acid transport system permease protein